MQFIVQADVPSRLDPAPDGGTRVLNNQSAVDVYFADDYQRLASTPTGGVPNGSKLGAGISLTLPISKRPFYFRAVSQTQIEVL
jgi:hypothetical protein